MVRLKNFRDAKSIHHLVPSHFGSAANKSIRVHRWRVYSFLCKVEIPHHEGVEFFANLGKRRHSRDRCNSIFKVKVKKIKGESVRFVFDCGVKAKELCISFCFFPQRVLSYVIKVNKRVMNQSYSARLAFDVVIIEYSMKRELLDQSALFISR